MKSFHSLYLFAGHVYCKLCLCWWKVRDFVSPPKEKAVLFVAHPDDDTLFFHTFIKENKPYVVLCTAGWSLRRLPCFFKAMRHYGLRYRAYDMGTRDKRERLLQRRVRKVFAVGNFEMCATHNATGEYGHEMHRRVHDAVVQEAKVPVLVPVEAERISNYPVTEEILKEKQYIFRNIYTTETWVLEQYALWVSHEQLELFEA